MVWLALRISLRSGVQTPSNNADIKCNNNNENNIDMLYYNIVCYGCKRLSIIIAEVLCQLDGALC
ncbi:MAG: hypothetical protein ACKPKO_44825 [Candidatus Fonsibacter sp.]